MTASRNERGLVAAGVAMALERRGECRAVSVDRSVPNWPLRCAGGACERGRPWRTEAVERRRLGHHEAAVCVVAAVVERQHVGIAAQHQQREPSPRAAIRSAIRLRSAANWPQPSASPSATIHGTGVDPDQQRHLVGVPRDRVGEQPGLLARAEHHGAPAGRRSDGVGHQEAHPADVEDLRDRPVGAGGERQRIVRQVGGE